MKKTRALTILATVLLAITLAMCLNGCFIKEIFKKTVTVTLDSNGGTPLTKVEYQGEVGTSIADMPSPEKEGFSFAGWYDVNDNKITSFVYPESDAKWRAKYKANSDMELEFSISTELNREFSSSIYWTEEDFENEDKPYIRFLSKSEIPFSITLKYEERVTAPSFFTGIGQVYGKVGIVGANSGDTLYVYESKNYGSFVEHTIVKDWIGTKLYGGSDGRYIQMKLETNLGNTTIYVRNIKLTFKYTLPEGALI